MNKEKKTSLADIINSIVKIIGSLLVIFFSFYVIYLFKSDKLFDAKNREGFAYNVCEFVVGSKVMAKLDSLSNIKTKKLEASDSTLIATADSLIITDIYQTEIQSNLSKEIDDLRRLADNKTARIKTGWIYAGSVDNKTQIWKTRYFDFDELDVSRIYEANDALNLRESAPSKATGVWLKGKVIGGVRKGERFQVTSIQTVPGTHERTLYWVQIIIL